VLEGSDAIYFFWAHIKLGATIAHSDDNLRRAVSTCAQHIQHGMVHVASFAVGLVSSYAGYYATSHHLLDGRNRALKRLGAAPYQPPHAYGANLVRETRAHTLLQKTAFTGFICVSSYTWAAAGTVLLMRHISTPASAQRGTGQSSRHLGQTD
jgi:hypothetical protein